jgi:hypothetical protein
LGGSKNPDQAEGMTYVLVIKPLAEKDITEIYTWYNQKEKGMGDTFLDQFEKTLDFVKKNPEQYQIRYKDVRMVKVNRFPVCLQLTLHNRRKYCVRPCGFEHKP